MTDAVAPDSPPAEERLADLTVGERLPTLEKDVRREQLFRYSAVTWNAHRIHFDPEHARAEDHPDILVQQHFHGAIIQELVMDWIGTVGTLSSLAWKNVGRATPEERLFAEAEVVDVEDEGTVVFDVWTRTEEERCAEGTVTVTPG
jgi:hydroxyacyl-ACP dehydratase HTD2-like protein with hotdog domain